MQDAAYVKQNRQFGCYGEIEEEAAKPQAGQDPVAGNINSGMPVRRNQSYGIMPISDVETRFLKQKPLKYSKNDPFGVNMRLRQSLSCTNQILFRQDNQRYIESMATTFGPQLLTTGQPAHQLVSSNLMHP